MSAVSYVCIDDQLADIQPKLLLLRRAGSRLAFESLAPNGSVEKFVEQLALAHPAPQGLLLDLRLDRAAGESGRASFNAPTLASHLRSLMAQRKVPACPIVLWTLPAVRRSLYDKDGLSHQYFDLVLDKDQLDKKEELAAAHRQLVSLADGYSTLARLLPRVRKLASIMAAPTDDATDSRAESAFSALMKDGRSISDTARFIRTQLLDHEGPLISKETLCARLGVKLSAFDRSALAKELDEYKYSGPFAAAYDRWWWRSVQKWWEGSFKGSLSSLLSLSADDRVHLLSQRGLVGPRSVAPPIAEGNSTRYTCICQVLRQPLDPIDGRMLDASQLMPWQDRQFVSSYVVKNKSKYEFRLDRLDPMARAGA